MESKYIQTAEVLSYTVCASAPPDTIFTSNLPQTFNDGGAREFLSSQGWPTGLQDTFVNNLHKIAFRFFICDDSGSMATNDGHKLVVGSNKNKMWANWMFNQFILLTILFAVQAGVVLAVVWVNRQSQISCRFGTFHFHSNWIPTAERSCTDSDRHCGRCRWHKI